MAGKRLTKRDLIAAVARRTGVDDASAARMVEAMLEGIAQALARGQRVRLVGFGTFEAAVEQAPLARHPRAGERAEAPLTVPRFVPDAPEAEEALDAFVGIGRSGRADISERHDEVLDAVDEPGRVR